MLNVYVAEPMSMDQVKAIIQDGYGIRSLSSDRQPVNILRTGAIDAYGHRHRERPSPCGISVAHVDVTAGTQGALAREVAPETEPTGCCCSATIMSLQTRMRARWATPSCSRAQPTAELTQEGKIAILEQWVVIDFAAGTSNLVDCATAWCWPDRVQSGVHLQHRRQLGLFPGRLDACSRDRGARRRKIGPDDTADIWARH